MDVTLRDEVEGPECHPQWNVLLNEEDGGTGEGREEKQHQGDLSNDPSSFHLFIHLSDSKLNSHDRTDI